MTEPDYASLASALSEIDEDIEALQASKREIYQQVRNDYGKKIADAFKLAMKLSRMDGEKRTKREETEEGAFRILALIEKGSAPRATRTREKIEEIDPETGEVFEHPHRLKTTRGDESGTLKGSVEDHGQAAGRYPESRADKVKVPAGWEAGTESPRKAAEAVPERAAIAVTTIATAAGATTPAPDSAQSAGEAGGYATSVLPTNSPETASERPVVGLPATAQMGPQAVTVDGDESGTVVPSFLMKPPKPIRPYCQRPGAEDCGGYGEKHCHDCQRLMESVESTRRKIADAFKGEAA